MTRYIPTIALLACAILLAPSVALACNPNLSSGCTAAEIMQWKIANPVPTQQSGSPGTTTMAQATAASATATAPATSASAAPANDAEKLLESLGKIAVPDLAAADKLALAATPPDHYGDECFKALMPFAAQAAAGTLTIAGLTAQSIAVPIGLATAFETGRLGIKAINNGFSGGTQLIPVAIVDGCAPLAADAQTNILTLIAKIAGIVAGVQTGGASSIGGVILNNLKSQLAVP